ncbi:MAG: hypothetical protein ACLP5V_13525 [Candidatus Bathyarchaeia archaeon]
MEICNRNSAQTTFFAAFRNIYELPIVHGYGESGWRETMGAPRYIGRDVNLKEVRAVADLARFENWDDILHAVLPSLQDETPRHEVTSKESMRRIVSNKLAILSPYLALIGLVSVVIAAASFRRRKS